MIKEQVDEVAVNRPGQVLFASLIGTTIEFFDFYIYATAAVLVFPKLFFPASDPASARLASLATFAIAFVARPIGSALFGHFGDRVGRKTTLVAALLTMGPLQRIQRLHRFPHHAIHGGRRCGELVGDEVSLRTGGSQRLEQDVAQVAQLRRCGIEQAIAVACFIAEGDLVAG